MLDKFLAFVDRNHLVATSILYSILFFTLEIIADVVSYGLTEPASMQKAAIIAAILTPISGLQAAVISFYNKRKDAK
ncbi:MAG: hypothetical protein GY810_28455 [Aureispira sp.]|nr:hypothetical protein [Aureispira sp.]